MNPQLRDVLLLLGLGLIFTVVAALLVYLRHKSRREKLGSVSSAAQPVHERRNALFGKNKKRRFKEKRPRKPSLAEAGGLPPLKDQTPEAPN